MAPHHRGGQNELIFVNNSQSGQREKIVVEKVQEGEHVDLEIIILGPKRRAKRQMDSKKRNQLKNFKKDNISSSRPADSDTDSDEANKNSGAKDTKANKMTDKTDQARKANQGADKSPSPSVSPRVDESLLKRLELRYGQKRLVADDDTYVDYMDYF